MEKANPNLIIALQQSMSLDLKAPVSFEELQKMLIELIDQLIQFDFPRLVNLLYRIDISEEKLILLLKENQQVDAAKIIAALIIERLLEKINSRQVFGKDGIISDEESW